ncbi:MAG: class I SAM-dependent methyltransferase [Actinobacteria bacterium]|nr:class I SAM-dependent methyltransferase [Actinomycetota bacterium]
MPEWYESFFDALANDVWRALMPAEASDAEAAFLVRQLCASDEGTRLLLDVPCGDGRLALRMVALGHDIVGVDLSSYAIDRLRTDDTSRRVDARVGDLRDLGAALIGTEAFDGAWCMGNSFGYLGHRDTVALLDGLAAKLRPGARFVLDAATVAEIVLPRLGERDRHEAGGAVLTNVHTYEVRTSTMVTATTLELGDQRDDRVARHRVMTCREIVDLVEDAGFSVEEIAGGLDGEEFRVGAPRCLITARRI